MADKRRLNWIGIALFGVGAAVAVVAVLYWLHVRPTAGAEIDRVVVEDGHGKAELIIRAEDGGDRSFVELVTDGEVQWQALIPRYAGQKGRPAIAWGQGAATVRVERGGRAEVFALALVNGDKLGGIRLAAEHDPITTQPTGPITVTDHRRSYELVGGADWHQVVCIDLAGGKQLWKQDLGPEAVTAARVEGDTLVIEQGAHARRLAATTGAEQPVTGALK